MYRKLISRKLLWLFCLPFLGVLNAVVAQEKLSVKTPEEQIVLKIAVVANAPTTTLAFVVTNNGKTDLRTSGLAATWNRIVVSDPDGKEIEIYDRVMEVEPTIIKSSQSKTWEVEILPVLDSLKLDKPGMYKLYWKLRDITTNDLDFKYKSNEIFLLREEKSQKK